MSLTSPGRDTDRDWEAIAASDPYFGSLNNPRYKGQNLPPEIVDEFFQTGAAEVAHLLRLFDRSFSRPERFTHVIDFGCGVGRLLRALVPLTENLTGVDVSQPMLKTARRHVPDAILVPHIPDGPFDWINSFVVFQHILPERGMDLLEQLLARAAPNCLLSLHFTISVLAREDQGDVGRISLYEYDVPLILNCLADAGFTRVVTEYLRHGEDRALRLVSARGRYAI